MKITRKTVTRADPRITKHLGRCLDRVIPVDSDIPDEMKALIKKIEGVMK